MALLVVLESLTPAERVVFILHDVFSYPFKEVGQIVGRSPEACRQLAGSARQRLGQDLAQPRHVRDRRRTVIALKVAWESNDLDALMALPDPNAWAITDGGGQVQAAIRPILGARNVASALLRVAGRYPAIQIETISVNGENGLVTRDVNGNLLALITLSITEHTVQDVWVLRNPNKLRNWI